MAATAHFKGTPGATYGFTDEDGRQQHRNADANGIVGAVGAFEESHFASLGLKPAEKKAAKKRSTKRATKASSKKAEEAPAPAPTANEEAAPPAEVEG